MSIRIITEPSVYLVGRQTIDEAELERFLHSEEAEGWSTDTNNGAQTLVEVGGRLCYKSYAKPRPGGNAAYIGHILEVGHGSVLEHAVYNLIITGVSRSLTHELVRHRVGISPSQRSQRYCDEGDAAFVVPPALEEEVASAKQHLVECGYEENPGACYACCEVSKSTRTGLLWLRDIQDCQDSYAELSDYLVGKMIPSGVRQGSPEATAVRKMAREAARSVLPNATETQIFITANARALRHFMEMRGDAAADAEMRRLAVAVLAVLVDDSPNLFGDYVVTPTNDGGATISTKHRKV